MPRISRRYTGTKSTPIQLTERDKQILERIHAFDGVMSLQQIDRVFFSGKGGTWVRERMRALEAHGYVQSPKRDKQYLVPVGQKVYWLGRSGAELVAGLNGDDLRAFSWRKTARWSKLKHDLTVNDFRLDVTHAVAVSSTLELKSWIHEGVFLSDPDTVQFTDRRDKKMKRQIRPDSFFTIEQTNAEGATRVFAYLLEIDMATEHNPRFVREKVRPGLAYIKSRQYQERFGYRFGRWLVVTTSQQRLDNMVRHAELAGAHGLFYFTTFDQVTSQSVLHDPIWTVVSRPERAGLIPAYS